MVTVWFYLETSWYTIIQFQPEAEPGPRRGPEREALHALGDDSGELQPEEEPPDDYILNANPEEWAIIMAEAMSLASENFDDGDNLEDLRERGSGCQTPESTRSLQRCG